MSICYKKLWKLLIDMDLNKTDLLNATGISSFTIAKMTRGDNVSTSILTRICEALKCDIGTSWELSRARAAKPSW